MCQRSAPILPALPVGETRVSTGFRDHSAAYECV